MRVRISYSVEMDNVPQEVSELLKKRAEQLDAALNLLEDAAHSLDAKDPDLGICYNTIEKIRIKLAEVDATLADCHGILTGLLQAREQLENPPPQTPFDAVMDGLPDDPSV